LVNNKLMRGGLKLRALREGCFFLGVLHLITLISCIRSKNLSFRLELSIDQSGFAMDTNPQHDAGNRLPPGVPNGRADSEIQKCRYAGSGSEFTSIYNPGNGAGFSGEHPGPPVL
jgi:hypothetical protein